MVGCDAMRGRLLGWPNSGPGGTGFTVLPHTIHRAERVYYAKASLPALPVTCIGITEHSLEGGKNTVPLRRRGNKIGRDSGRRWFAILDFPLMLRGRSVAPKVPLCTTSGGQVGVQLFWTKFLNTGWFGICWTGAASSILNTFGS